MATGIVKWFNNQKGYGFICREPVESPENSPGDVFAHFSEIVMEGYKSLKAGQKVNFEVNTGPKGLNAKSIQPMAQTMPD